MFAIKLLTFQFGHQYYINKGHFEMSNQTQNNNQKQTPLRIIKTTCQNTIVELELLNPSTLTVLYNDHLYALFFLLYFTGENQHKEAVAHKISEARMFYTQKLHLHRKGCQQCCNDETFKRGNQNCQKAGAEEFKIKALEFL